MRSLILVQFMFDSIYYRNNMAHIAQFKYTPPTMFPHRPGPKYCVNRGHVLCFLGSAYKLRGHRLGPWIGISALLA